MDPLSILTSVVTLSAVVTSMLAKAQALHNAPQEINQLLNEVSDVQIVVHEVHKALKGRASLLDEDLALDSSASVTTILQKLERQLRDLNDIVNKSLSGNPLSGKVKYVRLSWLRNKDRVQEIRAELARLKLSLSVVWGSTHSLDLSRIRFQLEEISLLSAATQNGGQQCVWRTEVVRAPADGSNALETGLASSGQYSPSDQPSLDRNAVVTRATPNISSLSEVMTAAPSSTFEVVGTRSECARWCSCRCHKSRNLHTPQSLNKILGVLSVGYSGIPYISEVCNEKRCKRNLSSSFRVRYRYPSWLLARAFLMTFTSTVGAPQVLLNTLRVLPPKAEIFRLVISGDLQGVKTMFVKGEASIYDVDDQCWSLVHKAFLVGQIDVCQFLIEQGSDIGIEAENGSSIASRTWFYNRTLSKSSSKQLALHHRILELTDIEELVEKMQYTVFHKIVLGLSNLDLQQQLEQSTATIDDPDSEGFTALWWASARGDTEAVRLLLLYRASLNSTDKEVHGPLHVAAKPEVVQLLLDYGADVDTRDKKGRTPLHCWSYKGEERGGSVALLEFLLDQGADVNAQTRAGHTPLHYAVMYGRGEFLPLLLSRGAEMESRKYGDGYTPLMDAVLCRNPAAVKFLIQNGADYTAKTFRDETILHLCARNGDAATIRTLTAAGLSGLDPDAKDVHGMTAGEYLEERHVKSTEIAVAMKELLSSVQKRRAIEVDGQS